MDTDTFFSAYTALIATGTFVIGYLLGERKERHRIEDAAQEVRRTMAELREFLDRKRSVSPDHRDV